MVVGVESTLSYGKGRGRYSNVWVVGKIELGWMYLLLRAAFSAKVPITVPKVSKLGYAR